MTRLATHLSFMLALSLAVPALAERIAWARASVAVVTPAARGRGAARMARSAQNALARYLRKKGARVIALRGRKARALRKCLRRRACLRRKARRLRVDHVVVGAVRRSGRRFVVVLRLIDTDTGRTVARQRLRTRRARGLVVPMRRLLVSLASTNSAQSTKVASVEPSAPRSQATDGEEPPM